MHSSAKVFCDFVNWLLSLRFFSESQLSSTLEEFDGVQGVIESNLYISAYEELARYLARVKALEQMIAFFGANCMELSEMPAEQYYFVEAAIDIYASEGLDVSGLIEVSPGRYKEYLIGRFVGNGNRSA